VQGRFGVSGVEFCDDHHTALPLLFSALTPMLGPYTLLLASPPCLIGLRVPQCPNPLIFKITWLIWAVHSAVAGVEWHCTSSGALWRCLLLR
jgi:hypothetical protein